VASDRLASAGPRHHECARGAVLTMSVGNLWPGSKSRLRVTAPSHGSESPGFPARRVTIMIRASESPEARGVHSPARIRKPDHEAAARRRHHAMLEARVMMRNSCCRPAPGPGPEGCGGRGSLGTPGPGHHCCDIMMGRIHTSFRLGDSRWQPVAGSSSTPYKHAEEIQVRHDPGTRSFVATRQAMR
jgi:hypothetical protein